MKFVGPVCESGWNWKNDNQPFPEGFSGGCQECCGNLSAFLSNPWGFSGSTRLLAFLVVIWLNCWEPFLAHASHTGRLTCPDLWPCNYSCPYVTECHSRSDEHLWLLSRGGVVPGCVLGERLGFNPVLYVSLFRDSMFCCSSEKGSDHTFWLNLSSFG